MFLQCSQAQHSASFEELTAAQKEMERLESVLLEELTRHFSLRVDLRQFEELPVKLSGSDEVHRLSHLGRVTLKNPQLIMINFADRPAAIHDAKLALQKSALNVNPQQEGIVLYVPVPRMTRERREQLAKDARQKLFNDFKKAVNEVSLFPRSPSRAGVRQVRQEGLQCGAQPGRGQEEAELVARTQAQSGEARTSAGRRKTEATSRRSRLNRSG